MNIERIRNYEEFVFSTYYKEYVFLSSFPSYRKTGRAKKQPCSPLFCPQSFMVPCRITAAVEDGEDNGVPSLHLIVDGKRKAF